ncbi:hypothetical protein VKT23_006788 [Stygiomarasmius scandens]|uniref:Calcineurin-like phosphoesterase domain-containing protein n=1 Tax=Marasmiellus scandens TaxID=2682957 RepID=A0ABR1JP38_9AGAR
MAKPYRSTVEESARRLSDFATESNANSSLGKFIYLNRTRYDVSETLTILGCTLWSALNPEDLDILSWSITDFRRIDSFNPEAYSALHRGDLDWLNNTVSSIAKDEPHRKVVIFTHHAPTKDGTGNPKFNDGPTNSAFATELSSEPCWDSKVVKTWAFGHTHWCCNFEKGGIMVFANQRGYGDGAAGYNVETVLDL